METESTKSETLFVANNWCLPNIVAAYVLSITAFALYSCVSSEVAFLMTSDIAKWGCWLFLIWAPFVFAAAGLLICRSVWRKYKRKWIAIVLLAIPVVLDAGLIILYVVSQFATVILVPLI